MLFLSQLLSSAIVAWKQPLITPNKWVSLCSNKTLFMEIDTWISHNFHIPFFFWLFDHLKMWKTLSLELYKNRQWAIVCRPQSRKKNQFQGPMPVILELFLLMGKKSFIYCLLYAVMSNIKNSGRPYLANYVQIVFLVTLVCSRVFIH